MKTNSFKKMAEILGVETKNKTFAKPKKCFKCGSDMRHIEGTNVFVCDGVTEDKNGNKKRCSNTLLWKQV